MHPIDDAIYRGTLTIALLEEHAAQPLPPQSESYWGDEMRALLACNNAPLGQDARPKLARLAARNAARQMHALTLSLDALLVGR